MELLNAIKIQAKCKTNNELKELSPEKKKRIANLIEDRVPSGLATIAEWNEVISCFGVTEIETNSKKAKEKLLSILREEKD